MTTWLRKSEQIMTDTYMKRDTNLCGNNAVHGRLCEGVELLVLPAHELRLEQVAAAPVILKLTL